MDSFKDEVSNFEEPLFGCQFETVRNLFKRQGVLTSWLFVDVDEFPFACFTGRDADCIDFEIVMHTENEFLEANDTSVN